MREKLKLDTSAAAKCGAFVALTLGGARAARRRPSTFGARVVMVHEAKGPEFGFVAIADGFKCRLLQTCAPTPYSVSENAP